MSYAKKSGANEVVECRLLLLLLLWMDALAFVAAQLLMPLLVVRRAA